MRVFKKCRSSTKGAQEIDPQNNLCLKPEVVIFAVLG